MKKVVNCSSDKLKLAKLRKLSSRDIVDDFFRWKIEIPEQVCFKFQCFVKIPVDHVFFGGIVVTVTIEDIFESVGERNHLVVADAFVGIVNYLFGPKNALGIEFCREIF